MSQTVAPSSEAHRCQLFALPTDAHFLVAGSHTYTTGSHHMIVFRTDLKTVPPEFDGVTDCYAGGADGNGIMGHVRGVVYGSQVPTGSTQLPAGVGLELNAGEIVLFQTHYLNASTKPLDARADVTLVVSDGQGITTKAGTLFYYDPFIDVPPNTHGARAQMRCKIPQDVTIVGAQSHYHARGVDYAAYLDPPTGPESTTPFYTSSDWDHPKSLAAPMQVAAGSFLRYSCTYDNADATKEFFQGQSAANDEMCMFIGMYYPRLDDRNAEFCMPPVGDEYGTGTMGCGDMLTCVSKCPPFPKAVGLGGNVDVDPCWQKCFVSSCPAASRKLFDLNDCTQSSCATECADSSSSACQSCALSKCSTQTTACLSDACK